MSDWSCKFDNNNNNNNDNDNDNGNDNDNDKNHVIIITSAEGEGYVSISVRLFVCLTVSNVTGKREKGFTWNLQDRSDLIQGTSGTFGGCSLEPLAYRIIITVFRGSPCLITTLREKNGWILYIFMKFSGMIENYTSIFCTFCECLV